MTPPSDRQFDSSTLDTSVPVLILGGRENALSIARHLGRRGITVRVSGPSDCWGMNSRYCAGSYAIPRGVKHADFWSDLLLGAGSGALDGSVLLFGSDTALEFIAQNHAELDARYRLPDFHPDLTLALLNKAKTMDLAHQAGVAAPQIWRVENEDDLERLAGQVQFPVMVKPIHSHLFTPVMGRKLFIIENSIDLLVEKVRLSWQHNLDVMIMEMIPGPDSELSSYYTFIDKAGTCHFEYTKNVIRRFPENRGLTCHHATKWLPETAEAGRAFFRGIGFHGLGNVEFKRDIRDGKLKIIEANPRFTAAQELVLQSGAPIDLICYCIATGQPAPTFSTYREDLRSWYGLRDTMAFLQLRRAGKITTREWLGSISLTKNVSPLHDIRDPYPTIGALGARITKTLWKG